MKIRKKAENSQPFEPMGEENIVNGVVDSVKTDLNIE